jgi:hypothetical protein
MQLHKFGLPLALALTLGAGISVGVNAQGQGKEGLADVRDSFLTPIAKGAGQQYLAFTPSTTGRVAQITTPAGVSHIFASTGNYEICAGSGSYAASTDFYTVSIVQPNGGGTLPLTITTRTNDNRWQIKWTYAINTTDVELLVTGAVKNLQAIADNAYLGLRGDYDDDGTASSNVGDASA